MGCFIFEILKESQQSCCSSNRPGRGLQHLQLDRFYPQPKAYPSKHQALLAVQVGNLFDRSPLGQHWTYKRFHQYREGYPPSWSMHRKLSPLPVNWSSDRVESTRQSHPLLVWRHHLQEIVIGEFRCALALQQRSGQGNQSFWSTDPSLRQLQSSLKHVTRGRDHKLVHVFTWCLAQSFPEIIGGCVSCKYISILHESTGAQHTVLMLLQVFRYSR